MTQALYLSDLTSSDVNVIDCQFTEEGLFAIQLAETPFHPQGGGQPSDVGKINEVDVVHVAMQGNEMIHYCHQAIPLGQAHAQVDVDKRHYYSRLHSAGHLVGHVMQALGWQPIKAQHWPDDSKVEFIKQDASEDIDIQHLQILCQQHIKDDLSRCITQDANGHREINFGQLPAFSCGGTHVRSLSEIGEIDITAYKFKKDKLTIYYSIAQEQA